MRKSFAFIAVLPFLLAVQPVSALPAQVGDATLSIQRADDDLAVHLALPFASELVGAEKSPVFAWVENKAGVRSIWVSDTNGPARMRVGFANDDGVELSALALSADGTKMLFTRGGDSEFPDGSLPNTGLATEVPEQALYIMDVGGAQAPRKIGQGHNGVFSRDGTQIVYTRRGEIWLSKDGNMPRRLATVRGSVSDLQWSPDDKRLLFRESRSGHSYVGLLTIETGSLRYPGSTLGHSSDPTFSPDGRQIAFIQFRDPPAEMADSSASFWSVRTVDITKDDTATGGNVRTVWSAPVGEGSQYYGTRGRNLFWSQTGQLLFPWERTGWMHIYAVSAERGGAARDLTPDANEVENFIPTPDGKSIVYTANAGNLDARQIWRSDINRGKPIRLTRDETFFYHPVFGGDKLAATATDVWRPAHPVLVEGEKPLGQVSEVRSYTRPETVVIAASDGGKVYGQLFHGKGVGPHPAIVFVHGGPRRQMLPGFHPKYYYSNAYILNQTLAAQGYTVLSVNYRSGTNYGQAFRTAPGTARDGAAEYLDVLAAGKWLAKRSDIKSDSIGIWGGSWGGYLTALALARNSDVFASGVDLHGVHSMVRPVEKTYSPEAEEKARQLQWQSSPLGAIESWRSPVLIVHGDDDENVDYSQSLLLARELTARGVHWEEIDVPNERHTFFRYRNWLDVFRAANSFFARTLKNERKTHDPQ